MRIKFILINIIFSILLSAEIFSQQIIPVIPEVTKENQICFAMYTVQNNIMKMSAQLYPLEEDDDRFVRLEINEDGQWLEIARERINENSYHSIDDSRAWNVLFRIEYWDSWKDVDYRVAYGETAYFYGKIRKDPVDKETIVVAAFTGNSSKDRTLRPDIIANIKAQDPDLLFFSGDQSYDHKYHLAAWLLFGRQFGEIIKDRPTIAIPDDHDVGQGNLWGEGGIHTDNPAGGDGGYFMPAEYVKEVERAQTGNLPDPYDPTPVEQGIGVYYTSINVGGIDFAIIEDRKFKSGPAGLVPQQGPRPDQILDLNYDPETVDVLGAQLLGERQLKFLNDWGQKWEGVQMKSVLSQTVFANAAHIHHGNRLMADMDSNGWPQTGRNKALEEIRKSFSFMIGGDQHLATVIHHGIDDWDDAGYSFCVPSIVNYYPREWQPLLKGIDPISKELEFTGKYFDGFHNKITMYAYANPNKNNTLYPKWREDGFWGKLAAGYGIIRFNKTDRTIKMECWPRGVDVTKPYSKQFPGWSVTIKQQDNYSREAVAWLPEILVKGMEDPVISVFNESNNELVYSLRINGKSFKPKVFEDGRYTIKIGDGGAKEKVFSGIQSEKNSGKTIKVTFTNNVEK